MPPIIGRLPAALLKGEELVAEINESSVFAFAAQLEVEQPAVELQRLVDVTNLDRNVRLRMRDELRSLQQRLKITTVLVTHDQEEALSMADRVAVMDAGRVEQTGRPLDFALNPANSFVSNFFGLQE